MILQLNVHQKPLIKRLNSKTKSNTIINRYEILVLNTPEFIIRKLKDFVPLKVEIFTIVKGKVPELMCSKSVFEDFATVDFLLRVKQGTLVLLRKGDY